MPVVHAKIRVAEDGSISGKAPRELPPGEYQAPITVPEPKPKRRRLDCRCTTAVLGRKASP